MDGSELLGIFSTASGAPWPLQLAFAIGYVVGSVLWARFFFGVLDPALRRALGGLIGAEVGWVRRRGTYHDPEPTFGPDFTTWMWGLARPEQRTIAREIVVYALCVLIVFALAGALPLAVLLAVFLGTRFLSVVVALPLLFLSIPLYTRHWTGREPPASARHSG